MATILGRRLTGLLAALLCCTAALVAGPAAPAGAGLAAGPADRAAPAGAGLAAFPADRAAPAAGLAEQPAAGPGANLLLNPGAQTGAASAQGWDAVTVPGWQVSSGLPTVVHYGVQHLAQ